MMMTAGMKRQALYVALLRHSPAAEAPWDRALDVFLVESVLRATDADPSEAEPLYDTSTSQPMLASLGPDPFR